MKNASDALKTYLATADELIYADLWTITLPGGQVLRYTCADINLNPDATLFTADDVLVEGGDMYVQYGLESNTTDVTFYPSPNSMAGGIPFMQAVANGAFKRADIVKQRIFMPTWKDYSLGAVTIFQGQLTESESTRYTAKFTCKDVKNLLNLYMPQRQFQPTCAFVFGDANCGFDRSTLAVNSSVDSGSSLTVVLSAALTQPAGYFNNGVIKMTSGKNAGQFRSIKTYNPGYVQIVTPFPVPVSAADTFTITPGCSKSFDGQQTTINGSVVTGSNASFVLNGIGAASGTYNGDNLVFTSGGNNGQSRKIQNWLPNEAIMASPFTAAPAPGDTFNITNAAGTVLTSGATANILSSAVIPTSLPNSDGFFTGGVIAFTSGALNGQTQTIASWADGVANVASAFSQAPALGDTFTITSAAGVAQGTCSGYFGADAPLHFGGQRFIPVPETAY